MRTFITTLAIALCLATNVRAAEYVVELKCLVFDRRLTDEEQQQVADAIKETPRKDRGPAHSKETLRLLNQNTNIKYAATFSMLVGPEGTVSQKMDVGNFLMEAHIRLLESKVDSCKLDIQWGAAMVVDERSTSSGRHTESRWIPLDTERQLSGGGGEGYCRRFLIHVREATDKDLAPKKLEEAFGDKLLKKLRPPRHGDITL